MSFKKANYDYYSEDKVHEFHDDNINVEYGKNPESEENSNREVKKMNEDQNAQSKLKTAKRTSKWS